MYNKKRIYYLPTSGRLGNWLTILAHLLAFANQFDYEIVLRKSDELETILNEKTKKSGLLKFSSILSQPLISLFVNYSVKYLFGNKNKRIKKSLFLNQPFDVDQELNKDDLPIQIVINNWLFRYYSGVVNVQNELRKQLAFNEASFMNAKQLLEIIEQKFPNRVRVGIHVRRGDYIHWRDGRWFFDNETYYAKMTSMANQLKESLFIICSNEKIEFDNPEKLSILYAKGSPAEDILLLSKCNFIIGPPSTFSSYAAFLGDQNLLFLENKDTKVELGNFKKYYLK